MPGFGFGVSGLTSLPFFLPPKVFSKTFCRSQLPLKSVNLSFTTTNTKNKLTHLCGIRPPCPSSFRRPRPPRRPRPAGATPTLALAAATYRGGRFLMGKVTLYKQVLDADGLFILSSALAATPQTPTQVPACPLNRLFSFYTVTSLIRNTHPPRITLVP
jgi:hypothetical protein